MVACMILSLEYRHTNQKIHRDIRPENIVFDSKGYARISNLELARIWTPENFQDTSGTPGYIAPEVVTRKNHGIAVDYFALGVITYEFMMGKVWLIVRQKPYEGTTKGEVKNQILGMQATVKKSEIPAGWSLEAADFINRVFFVYYQCIQRNPESRMGVNGPSELKKHYWFKETVWKHLADSV